MITLISKLETSAQDDLLASLAPLATLVNIAGLTVVVTILGPVHTV